jgi:predicted flap endonuclease-1-like 5' DNA nuclease
MFSCCFWWFLLGALIGWLLNWLLCRFLACRGSKCCNKPSSCCDNTPNTLLDSKPAETTQAPPTPKAEIQKTKAPQAVATKAPKAFVLDTASAKAAGFKLKGPNDLTVVEGIGPKINELFNNAGVITFAQLAQQTVPQMQKVLDDAGARYKLAKPGTWAQQAALAAENKWAELTALQEKLTGGV